MRRGIIWFRNDLRLHDNEAFIDALHSCDEILPIYIFDDRVFRSKTKYGFEKTGKHRANFILEAVENLKTNLISKNSDLCIRSGVTEDIITDLCREHKISWVYCNRERTKEEVDVQDALEANLWTIGVEMRYSRGKMLYHTADLPFPITQTPDSFTAFRKEVEKIVPVRSPFIFPEVITQNTIDLDMGDLPNDLLPTNSTNSINKGLQLIGGETEALRQVKYYLDDSRLISGYKETRNELLGRDFSSKFSAYLSLGCLSPKFVFHEIKKYEENHGANESTYWLFFELLWRDFFRLIAKKYGNKIFQFGGIYAKPQGSNNTEQSLFNIWKEGRTGVPFIDANMRELAHTGFMSNRGRQNVASFLIHNMKMNWLLGAEYFESTLIDYDPCSNYGNWAYIAGVGVDPKQGRKFNILFQAQKHDPAAKFIKYWLPELDQIPAAMTLNPEKYSTEDFLTYNLNLGKDYPSTKFSYD